MTGQRRTRSVGAAFAAWRARPGRREGRRPGHHRDPRRRCLRGAAPPRAAARRGPGNPEPPTVTGPCCARSTKTTTGPRPYAWSGCATKRSRRAARRRRGRRARRGGQTQAAAEAGRSRRTTRPAPPRAAARTLRVGLRTSPSTGYGWPGTPVELAGRLGTVTFRHCTLVPAAGSRRRGRRGQPAGRGHALRGPDRVLRRRPGAGDQPRDRLRPGPAGGHRLDPRPRPPRAEGRSRARSGGPPG